MREEEKVVYWYNYKGIIHMYRLEDGTWKYVLTPAKIYEYINANRVKSGDDPYRWSLRTDVMQVGMVVGNKICELLDRCKKEYGDENDK